MNLEKPKRPTFWNGGSSIQITGKKWWSCSTQNLRSNKVTNKLAFNLDKNTLSKWKSACRENWRSTHEELRTFEFAFFWFFYDLLCTLQSRCFWNTKENKTCRYAPGILLTVPRRSDFLVEKPLAGGRRRGGGWPAGFRRLRSPAARGT